METTKNLGGKNPTKQKQGSLTFILALTVFLYDEASLKKQGFLEKSTEMSVIPVNMQVRLLWSEPLAKLQ